ncbi:hypothetical protein [Rhizobium mayense]|uniref:Uncharacterized protein n=1 Tax=Rhizobium mayense TaxID=1312184 RepID=A0ABT7K1D0_9HYPH|nr:hypothetical protein [Rhizobium mayense]MDL2402417.1 hypothetical protein [Rhizobium mayense]
MWVLTIRASRNEFLCRRSSSLDDIEKFSGRLKAIKDATGSDLVLFASAGALIADYGLETALLRVESL